MRHLLTFLLLAASAFAQTATITDTIATPFAGTFSGTVTVSLNSPALAQPLYSGNVTLSGWTQTVTVTAGAFTLTLYTNDLITPGGTSYTATYAPTSGSGWRETWIVPTGATTIREIRSTTVPSPSVRFTPSQITQAGATLGQGLRWNGSIWAPAAVLTDPMTTTGDLITRSGINAVRLGIGSAGQVLTVAGGLPTWAAPATNGTVTSVSVTTANGVSGTVATATSTPAITLSLGAITPSSVAATGTVTGSNLSGTNTGDQTSITGNAGTATALAANGTNCTAGSFPLGVDASGNAESCTAAVTASTGLSDSADIVRGGVALSTTGSIPFVTAAGVLGQDADFSFGSATDRMIVGNASVGSNAAAYTGYAVWAHKDQQSAAGIALLQGPSGDTYLNSAATAALVFRIGATEGFRLAPTTRNLLIGTTTDDGTNRLQVAGSARLATTANGTPVALALSATGTGSDATVDTVGSGAYMYLRSTLASPYAGTQINKSTNTVLWFTGTQGLDTYGWFTGSSLTRLASLTTGGTFSLYNETPTTGSTSLVVRAGAGQSSNNLQTWQNSAGTSVSRVAWTGAVETSDILGVSSSTAFSGYRIALSTTQAQLGSGVSLAFSATTEATATKDLSLSRASANVLQVGDGGANASGSLVAGNITANSTLNIGSVGSPIRFWGGASNDLSLSRASANTLQVGDGSANSNGTILARIHTWANGTEGTCDTTLRGQVVMVQGGAGVADTFRICRKDATDTYLWAPVDNNVALQVVSAGPTATVTNQVRRVYVDPASVIASLTLTLPATPLDADQVQVYFGGTVANKAAVVTTLSIAPNTGHAISQFNAPINAFGGDMVTYEYRQAASRWYRIQ